MRKNIVAGNWKMNKTLQEGICLAKELNDILKNKEISCDVILAPPFTHLASIVQIVTPQLIKVAAQNCSDKEQGAYTGEISAEMIKSTGATHVIIGHSERRHYYHETNEIIKNKIIVALKTGLTPIFCFGELLAERESNRHFEVVKTQLHESLFSLTPEDFSKIVLSYEPVWAIGTGKNATVEQAEEIHAFVRQEIQKKYGQQVADNATILYGGSCKPSNAKELFSSADVDGGLIGGASLVAADFMGIIESF
jgi:triosephosphate isomerase (TIM)